MITHASPDTINTHRVMYFHYFFFTMKLIHPSNIIVSGPTGSGKTQLVSRLLITQNIDPFPSHIVYLYSEWQEEYEKLLEALPQITFQRGFPDKIMDIFNARDSNLLILDDQMSKAYQGIPRSWETCSQKGATIGI